MTTPSLDQGGELTFSVWQPEIVPGTSYNPRGFEIAGAINRAAQYEQIVETVGGYWSSSVTFACDKDQAEEWIFRGLNRHLEVYDQDLAIVWEGFVNKISAKVGAVTMIRGPVMQIANRTIMTYSTVDTTVEPPAVGMRVPTNWYESAASLAKWGTLETALSTGGATDDNAIQLVETYLDENKEPTNSQTLTFPASGASAITIECLGYVHRMRKYLYNQTAATGLANLSDKMSAILAAQPDAMYGTGQIESNTLQVPAWENDNADAWGIMKGLIALGDVNENRQVFGIYAGLTPRYNAAPTTPEYSFAVSDADQSIARRAGGRVLPWNVLPARWLEISDFRIGQSQLADLRDDPRAMFIETATFRSPYNLTLIGGKVDQLSQQLASLGLSGIGG